jgi:hypothetical protein
LVEMERCRIPKVKCQHQTFSPLSFPSHLQGNLPLYTTDDLFKLNMFDDAFST